MMACSIAFVQDLTDVTLACDDSVVKALSLFVQDQGVPRYGAAMFYPNADRMQSPARQSTPIPSFQAHSRQVILTVS